MFILSAVQASKVSLKIWFNTAIIDERTRARVFCLRNVQRMSVREVSRLLHVSRSSVWRIGRETVEAKKKVLLKRCRPSKLTDRAKRHILRCFSKIRESEGTFCVKRLMQQSGISERDVTPRTINRFLNDNGYQYLQARKKGLTIRKDLKDRVAFATAVLHERPTNFLTDQVAFIWMGQDSSSKQTHSTKLEHPEQEYGENRQRDSVLVARRKERRKEQEEKC